MRRYSCNFIVILVILLDDVFESRVALEVSAATRKANRC